MISNVELESFWDRFWNYCGISYVVLISFWNHFWNSWGSFVTTFGALGIVLESRKVTFSGPGTFLEPFGTRLLKILALADVRNPFGNILGRFESRLGSLSEIKRENK